jgi:hypothetical protein
LISICYVRRHVGWGSLFLYIKTSVFLKARSFIWLKLTISFNGLCQCRYIPIMQKQTSDWQGWCNFLENTKDWEVNYPSIFQVVASHIKLTIKTISRCLNLIDFNFARNMGRSSWQQNRSRSLAFKLLATWSWQQPGFSKYFAFNDLNRIESRTLIE